MAKTTANPTVEQIEALRSYLASANNGRGRIVGVTRQLLDRGWLTLQHTSANTWTLSISPRGRRVLDVVVK